MTQDSVREENEVPGNKPFVIWLLGSWPVTALESVLEMVKYRKLSCLSLDPEHTHLQRRACLHQATDQEQRFIS